MILYRCNPKSGGGGGSDVTATYTAKVDNIIQNGSCAFKYTNNSSYNPSSTLTIGDNVNRCDRMFDNAKFNCDVILGNKVDACWNMFSNTNYGKNVYLKGKSFRPFQANGMFYNCNNSVRKNIFFNINFNNRFNVTNADSIVGSSVTWTTMTNGFYNTAFNVYCYYNYSE